MIVKLPEMPREASGPTIGPVDAGDIPPLTNPLPPPLELQHEKPWHRLAIMLAAEGHSYVEIAERTGFTPVSVSTLMRQPWARELLLHEIHRAGRDELRTILKGAARDSIFKLISLRDEAKNENVQLNAARELIDRFLGKAVQPIAEVAKPTTSMDIDSIDREIASLDEKTAQIIGRKTPVCQTSQSM